jgi:phage terminase large subunit-like protein
VVDGKIPACKWVRLACQRQLDDLKTRTIELEPWQRFLLTVIFGWVDAGGFRRYRKAYVEVPRKNAKTTICAGIALFLLCADREPGAEIYSAAVTRDQAKISWDIAREMVKRDPEMRAFYGVEPLALSIVIPGQAASFKPLSRDADSLEGLNRHGAIIDELHAHKTREVFDVINLATGSRRQRSLDGGSARTECL